MQKAANAVGYIALLLCFSLCLVVIFQVRSLKYDIDAAQSSLSDLQNKFLTAEESAVGNGVNVVVTNLEVVVTNTIVHHTSPAMAGEGLVANTNAVTPLESIGTNTNMDVLVLSFKTREYELQQRIFSAESDVDEAKSALKQLVLRDEKNMKEKLALQKQIASLSASLSLLKAENQLVEQAKDRDEVGVSVDVASVNDVSLFDGRVTDYNKELDMVILNLGTEHGIKPQMKFSVMNQGRWIARIRVIDPRRKMSGAEIEEKLEGHVPKAGDRVIPWKSDVTDGS